MIRLFVAFCFLTTAAPARSVEPEASWAVGLQAFRTGRERLLSGQPSRADFRRAATAFAACLDSHHAESYLNLGNAYYLAGDLPEAVAAFNAGLAIDPSEGRLHENLALARGEVLRPADSRIAAPAPIWQHYIFQTYIDVVGVIALLGSSLLIPFSFRTGRWLWLGVGLTLATIAAVASAAIVLRARYFDDIVRRPVRVLRVDSALRLGNADSYPAHSDASVLPRGYEVRQMGVRAGWLHVVTPSGTVGWIPERNVIQLPLPRCDAEAS